MVFVTSIRFRHLNFYIKGGTIHSIFLLSFHHCYVVQICINFLVKMKGNINKEMVERMKRKQSLDSKVGGNELALKINLKEKKIEKIVVTLFDKGKIIFSKMDKF